MVVGVSAEIVPGTSTIQITSITTFTTPLSERHKWTQFFDHLRAYWTTQRPIIKQAREKETKQIHTHKQLTKQNNLYHLNNNNISLVQSRQQLCDEKRKYMYIHLKHK
jgi:hypothetical protein